ncbi:MAG: AraC family transcriptional regulator [Polyangiaceae bacterium]|nr:AraC family transcriptional regulator [Polyangiaceae bacterium]
MADVLTDVLETVRVRAACHGRFELSAPWGVELGEAEGAQFHVVLDGSCHLTVTSTGEELTLSPGDLVTLPHGHAHILRDDVNTEARPFRAIKEDCRGSGQTYRAAGEGARTTLLSGYIQFEERRHNPLLLALPPVVTLRGGSNRTVAWLETTLQFMGCEAASGRPGSATVISRLADVLFIQIVRGYLADLSPSQTGWLAALNDAQIGAALQLVHAEPQEAWTVASLAAKVAMSRSAFAARFVQLVGEPPLQYVTRWRMQKATGFLRAGQATLAEVAEKVGYDSEAAFSKAFKRAVGSTPGAYRRSFREPIETIRAA